VFRKSSFIVLLAALLSLPGFGQAGNGSVRGTVRDRADAVIPGAKVKLTNTTTNVRNPLRSASAKSSTSQAPGSGRVALYAAVGAELTQYDVDVESATLVKRGSVMLPGNVQYAWPHPSRQYLYVAWSDGGPTVPPVLHRAAAITA
jgi:hypothetical protein